MQKVQLSTFKPRGFLKKGGIAVILPNQRVIPVAGDTSGLSEQARIIHEWTMARYTTTSTPVSVKDIIDTHGHYGRGYFNHDVKTLQAFPLEELQDASLLYPEEKKG